MSNTIIKDSLLHNSIGLTVHELLETIIIIISHHLDLRPPPIRSSEAPYKVKYRLNNTSNRWYGSKMQC